MLTDVENAGALAARPVVVCGAGAAGVAAALAASRCDAEVLLLETSHSIGGTVANALIHTIGGLYDASGGYLNEGLPQELAERLLLADRRTRPRKMGRVVVLQVCPNVYRQTLERWVGEEPRISILYKAAVRGIRQSGGRIIDLQLEVGDQHLFIQPRAVVDATGNAAIARLLGSNHIAEEGERAAGGLIFRLRPVAAGAVEFPRGIGIVRAIRAATESGRLPPECRHAWLDAGMERDEAFVKLLVPLPSGMLSAARQAEAYQRALAARNDVVAFLRQFPDFRQAVATQTGCLGIRDGSRIAGRHTLTADEVRTGRTFPDGACRCAWPIEFWDGARGVSIEYLPDGAAYEIPMRCLQLAGIENFWAAGKCLSADRYAHASARVAGACWAMGQAAGQAAAAWQAEEEVVEHEPLRPVSRYSAAATGSSRGDDDGRWRRTVVPRTG